MKKDAQPPHMTPLITPPRRADAGDYVKFGFPMASSVTVLAWGMIEFEDGYEKAGQMDYARESLKWATDYILKCHTAADEFYGQVTTIQAAAMMMATNATLTAMPSRCQTDGTHIRSATATSIMRTGEGLKTCR